MKVVFLDIDGVLVTWGSMGRGHKVFSYRSDDPAYADEQEIGFYRFEPSCVEHLNSITERTGAKIVVSSTWRYGPMDGYWRLLCQYIKDEGVVAGVIGRTGRRDDRIRGNEIQDWLFTRPDVDQFVILDDSGDMEHLLPRLVQTSMDGGLKQEHAGAAVGMLLGTSGSVES